MTGVAGEVWVCGVLAAVGGLGEVGRPGLQRSGGEASWSGCVGAKGQRCSPECEAGLASMEFGGRRIGNCHVAVAVFKCGQRVWFLPVVNCGARAACAVDAHCVAGFTLLAGTNDDMYA